MDQNQSEPTLEDSIKQVMQTLPPVILNYLAQGRHTSVARELMAKYGLRVDQGGVLEREIMLLLMGIENPNEFTQALAVEAQVDRTIISSIVKDVNDLIFVPLREEEEGKGARAPVAPPPQTAKPPVPAVRPAPVQVAREPLVAPAHKEESAVDDVPFAPLPPKVVMPRPVIGFPGRPPVSSPSLNLLQDRAPQVAPENLPGVMLGDRQPPATLEFRKAEPRAERPSPRVAREPEAAAPVTTYAADPYREPIDEPVDEM